MRAGVDRGKTRPASEPTARGDVRKSRDSQRRGNAFPIFIKKKKNNVKKSKKKNPPKKSTSAVSVHASARARFVISNAAVPTGRIVSNPDVKIGGVPRDTSAINVPD